MSKSVFHQFHLVKTYCFDWLILILSIRVDVVDHEFVLVSVDELRRIADIYVNDQVVNEQFLEGIEQDVWSYSVNDNVSVLMQRHCKN